MKRIILTATLLLLPFSVFAANIDATNKYARFLNTGALINFGATNGNVTVTSTKITGYAWGSDAGWINLSPTNGGVVNDGNGVLSGYAWGENTGWINFKPSTGGVTIDASGNFNGYAWSEARGWIVFNCATDSSCGTLSHKVQTTWVPPTSAPVTNTQTSSGGGGGPLGLYGKVNTQTPSEPSPTTSQPHAVAPAPEINTQESNPVVTSQGSVDTTPQSGNASQPTTPAPNENQGGVIPAPQGGGSGSPVTPQTFQEKVFGIASSMTDATLRAFSSIATTISGAVNAVGHFAQQMNAAIFVPIFGSVAVMTTVITAILAVVLLVLISRVQALSTLVIDLLPDFPALFERIQSFFIIKRRKEVEHTETQQQTSTPVSVAEKVAPIVIERSVATTTPPAFIQQEETVIPPLPKEKEEIAPIPREESQPIKREPEAPHITESSVDVSVEAKSKEVPFTAPIDSSPLHSLFLFKKKIEIKNVDVPRDVPLEQLSITTPKPVDQPAVSRVTPPSVFVPTANTPVLSPKVTTPEVPVMNAVKKTAAPVSLAPSLFARVRAYFTTKKKVPVVREAPTVRFSVETPGSLAREEATQKIVVPAVTPRASKFALTIGGFATRIRTALAAKQKVAEKTSVAKDETPAAPLSFETPIAPAPVAAPVSLDRLVDKTTTSIAPPQAEKVVAAPLEKKEGKSIARVLHEEADLVRSVVNRFKFNINIEPLVARVNSSLSIKRKKDTEKKTIEKEIPAAPLSFEAPTQLATVQSVIQAPPVVDTVPQPSIDAVVEIAAASEKNIEKNSPVIPALLSRVRSWFVVKQNSILQKKEQSDVVFPAPVSSEDQIVPTREVVKNESAQQEKSPVPSLSDRMSRLFARTHSLVAVMRAKTDKKKTTNTVPTARLSFETPTPLAQVNSLEEHEPAASEQVVSEPMTPVSQHTEEVVEVPPLANLEIPIPSPFVSGPTVEELLQEKSKAARAEAVSVAHDESTALSTQEPIKQGMSVEAKNSKHPTTTSDGFIGKLSKKLLNPIRKFYKKNINKPEPAKRVWNPRPPTGTD